MKPFDEDKKGSASKLEKSKEDKEAEVEEESSDNEINSDRRLSNDLTKKEHNFPDFEVESKKGTKVEFRNKIDCFENEKEIEKSVKQDESVVGKGKEKHQSLNSEVYELKSDLF